VYRKLERTSAGLVDGLSVAAQETGTPVQINRAGSMFTVFFTGSPVRDYESAHASDTGRYARFFHSLLGQGVYFPPSQFEACFVSLAHSMRDIAKTVRAAREAFTAAAAD
jgi:glutamate-1-semialdehyde 2,1-aminomutase